MSILRPERLAVLHSKGLLDFIHGLVRLNIIPTKEIEIFINELVRLVKGSRLDVMTYGLLPTTLMYIIKLDNGAINLYSLAYQVLSSAETGGSGSFVITTRSTYKGEPKRLPYALLLACIARVTSNFLKGTVNLKDIEDFLTTMNNLKAEERLLLEDVLSRYLAVLAMTVNLIAVELQGLF